MKVLLICKWACAPWQLLINGKSEDASSGKTFETYDPRTGEPLMTVAEAQAEDVDRAVAAARQVTFNSTVWWLLVYWLLGNTFHHSYFLTMGSQLISKNLLVGCPWSTGVYCFKHQCAEVLCLPGI